MNFTVNSSVLLEMLYPSIEVSSSIKCGNKEYEGFGRISIQSSKSDQKIVISAFNGGVAYVCDLDNFVNGNLALKVNEDGKSTFESKHLEAALSSFNKNQTVEFDLKQKDNTKELYIKNEGDKTEYQTVICYDSEIDVPEEASKFKENFKISREALIRGVDQVAFAFGIEEDKPQLSFFKLKISKDKLRFVSGMGGMFAVYEVEGNGVIEAKDKEIDMLLNNKYMLLLSSVLSSIKDDKIEVKETAIDEKYQIVFTSRNVKIIMVGINPDVKWPDEQTVLNGNNDLKIVTSVSEWESACKASRATHTDDMKKQARSHHVTFNVDSSKNILEVKTDHLLKSLRKIKIIDSQAVDTKKIYQCSTYSKFVNNIPTCWNSDGNVQLEFPADPSKKLVIVIFNASDKVKDFQTLKSSNSATGLQEFKLMMFVQTSINK